MRTSSMIRGLKVLILILGMELCILALIRWPRATSRFLHNVHDDITSSAASFKTWVDNGSYNDLDLHLYRCMRKVIISHTLPAFTLLVWLAAPFACLCLLFNRMYPWVIGEHSPLDTFCGTVGFIFDLVSGRTGLMLEIERYKRLNLFLEGRDKTNARLMKTQRQRIQQLSREKDSNRADRKKAAYRPRIFVWNLMPDLVEAGERIWAWPDDEPAITPHPGLCVTFAAPQPSLSTTDTEDGTRTDTTTDGMPFALSPSDPQDHGCTICLADFAYGENVMALPCGHVFHTECLEPWLKQTFSCTRCQRGLCWVMALKPKGEAMEPKARGVRGFGRRRNEDEGGE